MWQQPPKELSITAREVHVWRANLNLPIARVNELVNILSEDEEKRANRFYFEEHRKRFIVARGTLRLILAQYLAIAPEKFKFKYSDKGKPSLKGEQLQFNVSHAEDLALYGFTLERKIGVDVEYVRKVRDVENIAERFFSEREAEIIKQLAPEEKITAFLHFWTGKEAYFKATGEGISGGLDEIEIDLNSGLLRIKGDSQAALGWCLYKIIPGKDYLGTVAVEGQDLKLSFWKN
ncbi:MAG: 4'-phosphopantetheinyl transferase superfamily protein [Gomphosphaeria aponina SAG 52.96 = DSM 107014]|uniref:4'-phosphopantetheinyl transferase superfamily protein n=1 Tax=Gomphosphaeria aponina SAG 52.96 = DSM 107014 TaxID=1521640 RepID=A0A941JPN1_9CHRO|nr:4'-phosphopantetheinyl transferase superfamily protein [Gomphosphaeria aponina SAG 52.96 = DSM 107014]